MVHVGSPGDACSCFLPCCCAPPGLVESRRVHLEQSHCRSAILSGWDVQSTLCSISRPQRVTCHLTACQVQQPRNASDEKLRL